MQKLAFVLAAASLPLLAASSSHAEALAYGVSANGELFYFNTSTPATATTVGTIPGFVPEAIDFRPGTQTLYAIDVGPTTTQLYTINTLTAAATPVGPGFPTTVDGSYSLAGNNSFGFDFNPRTLQGDGSVRIRLVATNNTNLRLNSDTGLVAAVDSPLNIGAATSPFVDAAAYINSGASTLASAGPTTLYTMDSRSDVLFTQNPPNNGTQVLVGPFGVTVDANAGIGFDILSTNPLDDSLADEEAFAVFTRGTGGYLIYSVNLTTGATTGGAIVGSGRDFTGGLALTTVPEPTLIGMALAPTSLLLSRRRNRKTN